MRRFKYIFIILIILPVFISLINLTYYYNEKQLSKDSNTDELVYVHTNNNTAEKNNIVEEFYVDEPLEENEVMGEATEEYVEYVDYTVNDVVVEEVPVQVVEPVVEQPTVTNIVYNEEYSYQVLALINEIRRNNGLSELTMNYSLIQVANIRSEEISRNWSHTRPDGTDWWTIHSQYGIYGKLGENLAFGQTFPAEVVEDWMNSEGHRANILTPEFTSIGISVCIIDGTYYWSQEFLG